MPWRRTSDPYRILVAEYLLQRTRVVSGTPYYERFLARFPDVAALAAASEEEVLKAWEGLGYYRRARSLLAAAKAVVRDHAGQIPSDAGSLATLPGIGPYTAGAVASIAFGERVPAVDGNVTRVLARLFRVESDVTASEGKARIAQLAWEMVPEARAGAFNQALMELGATVCTPRRPRCDDCPLRGVCRARADGVQARLPCTRPPRRPEVVAVAFAYIRSGKRTLLVRRPESGLLGGLWALPGGEVGSAGNPDRALRDLVAAQTGLRVDVRDEVAPIRHTFSHRRWTGSLLRCVPRGRVAGSPAVRWVDDREIARLPLVPSHRGLLRDLQTRPSLESFAGNPRRGGA